MTQTQGRRSTFRDISDFSREDVFDSRDAEERIKYLEIDPDEDEAVELKAWADIKEETEGYSGDNWRDGIVFIRDTHFEEYAEQFADEIGRTNEETSSEWPYNHIDWTAAADELKQDYTSVEIDGVDFWYR